MSNYYLSVCCNSQVTNLSPESQTGLCYFCKKKCAIYPEIDSHSIQYPKIDRLYYTPPTDEQFNEVKREAITLWQTISNDEIYLREKILRIKDIKNVGDNFMYIVAMFDLNNQRLLAEQLNEDTCKAIRERMIEGGQTYYLIPF